MVYSRFNLSLFTENVEEYWVAYGTLMDADIQAQERREEQAQPRAREANQMLQLRQMLPKGTTFNNILYWVWFDLIRVVCCI